MRIEPEFIDCICTRLIFLNSNEEGNNGSGSGTAAEIGGIQVPEGIDPSFLAALPEEMRDEVIAEHLRYSISIVSCCVWLRSFR